MQGAYYSFVVAPFERLPALSFRPCGGIDTPQGLQLTDNASWGPELTGTPQVYGQFSFTIQETDSSSPPLQATHQYSLTIHQSGSPAFILATTTLPDAIFGAPYGPKILATGGVFPYYCSIGCIGAS